MSKLLCFQDLHADSRWYDETESDINRMCEVAVNEKVDAFVSGGDLWNKAHMATSQAKYDKFVGLFKKMSDIAPCYYVKGTPSHDPEGIYSTLDVLGWKEITIGKSHIVNGTLICGMPEITPSFIAVQNPELSKQELIEKQYNLVDTVIDNYYVPLSVNHNGPIHYVGHGHVSGAIFKADQKPRTSEFMFTESMLGKIKADYYQFGHIHFPQKFKAITGGYGGSAHMTWGDLDFQPGFDIVQHSDVSPLSKRFSYYKPMRRKIKVLDLSDMPNFESMRAQFDYTNTDLWIEMECDKSFSDQFDIKKSLEEIKSKIKLGPLSKITLDVKHEEHTRIDLDEYEACKSTEDLYKIFNPDVSESVLLKVREAEEATGSIDSHSAQSIIDFDYLYLKGSKAGLENGTEEIEINYSDFKTGCNLLTGPNGTGKSFLLGFCTPYSQHIPTGSDLKSLFDLKDSQVLRRFIVKGKVVTQKIVIDPTLSNPTAKYYMDIDGVSCENVTGNKAPFDTAVNDIFGSLKMFMACVFKGQKESKEFPSLENSKESDLRQIFTELSGTDRMPLKDYASNKAKELRRCIELDSREMETLGGLVKSDISLKIQSAVEELVDTESIRDSLAAYRSSLDSVISSFESDKQKNESIRGQMGSLMVQAASIELDITKIKISIDILERNNKNIDRTKAELRTLIEDRNNYSKLAEKYLDMMDKHNLAVNKYRAEKDSIDKKLSDIKERGSQLRERESKLNISINADGLKIDALIVMIDRENIPCEHCGKLSSSADEKISSLRDGINVLNGNILLQKTELDAIRNAIKTELENYKSIEQSAPKEPVKSDELDALRNRYETEKPDNYKISELEKIVSDADESMEKLAELKASVSNKSARMSELDNEWKELGNTLIEIDEDKYNKAIRSKRDADDRIIALTTEIGKLTAEISGLKKEKEENNLRIKKISDLKTKCESIQADITEWEAVSDAFSPKGIPALELSLIAPLIDREANRLLKSNSTRFRTEIITQDLDSTGKKVLEKFKILVHDSNATDVKNLPCLSPGQLAWVSTALTDAIAIEAQKRTGRKWLYAIKDEPDAALDPSAITDFYNMLDIAMDGERKLIAVSHSPTAWELIVNTKQITDFFKY